MIRNFIFYSFQIVKVFQQSNGHYVCIGSIQEGGDVVYSSVLILVLTQNGDQIQKIRFDDLKVKNVLQTSDDGYILFGSSMIKLNKDFNIQWTKEIIDGKYWSIQITPTSNNGFALTGTYEQNQIFLKTFESNGNEESNKIYKNRDYQFQEYGFDLKQLNDGGFLIVGRSSITVFPNNLQCQILRTNINYDTIWTKKVNYSTNSVLNRIIYSESNEFIIGGEIVSPNENRQSFLIKTNDNGQVLDSLIIDNQNCPFNNY